MKKLIHVLFAVAALSASLQPVIARASDKWAFMVLFYQAGAIVDSKIVGADEKAKCIETRKEVLKMLTEHYASTDVFYAVSECSSVPMVAKQKLKKERDA